MPRSSKGPSCAVEIFYIEGVTWLGSVRAAFGHGRDAAVQARPTGVRVGPEVALAWGYITEATTGSVDAKLDRILAMLWGLTHLR